jgi:cytochrome P450
LPLLGSVLDAWRDPVELLESSVRDHGDLVLFKFGPYRFLFLNDPSDIHHVLVERPKNYVKSRSYDGMKLLLGRGLLTNEGDAWRRQRKLAQPAFHHRRLQGSCSAMANATSEMLSRWEGSAPLFDLHGEMMRLTLRIVGQTLFGTDVDGDAAAIGGALDVAIHWTNKVHPAGRAHSPVGADAGEPAVSARRQNARPPGLSDHRRAKEERSSRG